MEGHGHDPVCGVKSFLHPIPVVDVDVNVQHSLVVPGKNQNIAFIVYLLPGKTAPEQRETGGEHGIQGRKEQKFLLVSLCQIQPIKYILMQFLMQF